MTLVEFLRARLDEDEEAALAAKGKTLGYWEDKSDPVSWITLVDKSGKLTMGEHRHIARHDPARALREVEAKRQILVAYEAAVAEFADSGPAMVSYDRLTGSVSSLRCAVVLLALPYVDHPDYQQEWALTPA